jgi:hypothetical protein
MFEMAREESFLIIVPALYTNIGWFKVGFLSPSSCYELVLETGMGPVLISTSIRMTRHLTFIEKTTHFFLPRVHGASHSASRRLSLRRALGRRGAGACIQRTTYCV